MLPVQLIHRPSLARQFDRRAKRLGQVDFLLREVEQRLFSRLDYIKINPQSVLDVGCGLGQSAHLLAQRFAGAAVTAIDQSTSMIEQAQLEQQRQKQVKPTTSLGHWWSSVFKTKTNQQQNTSSCTTAVQFVHADTHQLPLQTSSVDLVWSNLAMHWFADPAEVFGQWQRVLRPNGLALFSYFGPTTLQELRALGWALPTLQDLHDIGDALTKSKFAEPVMDMESLTVTYQDADKLVAELSALGGNPLAQRAPGLRGRQWREQMSSELARRMPIKLTFELVYGHAWIPERKSLPDGMAPIEFRPRRPQQ
jgi:malonyl-CoA O-methyltransferase